MRRLPLLTALPAFEATVRLGSVSAAALELGRTHSAVSKQLRHLSEHLGVKLFEKQGTGIVATDEAIQFGGVVALALDDLDRAAHALRAASNKNLVNVGMSATLATRWLTPRLPRFYESHPLAEIRLRMSGPTSLQLDNDLDILVSYDRLRGSLDHEKVKALGDVAYGPVCAPGFVIHKREHSSSVSTKFVQPGAADAWHQWSILSGILVESVYEVDQPHHILALEAAAAGLGMALAEKRLVENEIDAGRLVAPFGFVEIPGGFQAAVLADLSRRPMVSEFLCWLRDEAVVNGSNKPTGD